jgi:hypothetical protein
VSYAMVGDRVAVDVAARGSCVRRATWSVSTARRSAFARPGACSSSETPLPVSTARRSEAHGRVARIETNGSVTVSSAAGTGSRNIRLDPGLVAARVFLSGDRLIVVSHASTWPDRPDRLLVYDAKSGALVHDWPLFDRATTLDVHAGLALFRASDGLYIMRLADGRTALVSLNRRLDNAQLEAPGVVYQDNVLKGRRHGRVDTLKFVPVRVIERRLAAVTRPFLLPGRVRAFSMDGTRVAIAVDNPHRACDRLVFWNVPWRFEIELTKLLMPRQLTCPRRGAAPRITDVAFGGSRVQWLARFGRRQRLLAATILHCDIAIVRSGRVGTAAATALAGDGRVLAFAAPGRGGSSELGLVTAAGTGRTIGETGRALGLAADDGRIAVLRRGSRIELRSTGGRLLRTIRATAPRAIALNRSILAVLTRRDTVEVFDTRTGRRTRVWSVPRGAAGIDVYFGIAVLAVGRRVIAVELGTGKRAVLAHAPTAVRAEIDAPGVVYSYNVGGRGALQYMTLTHVETALG